jgi:hypothetical protein
MSLSTPKSVAGMFLTANPTQLRHPWLKSQTRKYPHADRKGGLPAGEVDVNERGGVGAAVSNGGQPLILGGPQMRPLVAHVALRR